MLGGAGDDTYVVDSLADVVTETANEGTDTVRSSVAWTLGANLENLTLTGTAALNGAGNTLNNVLTGNSAANTLDGGAGADTMLGGADDDTYLVDSLADVVTENANEGTDTVLSSLGWTLGANLENLTLTGTAGLNGTGNALNNLLTGNAAANVLSAGAGNDTLDGGAGADTMLGGAGDDTYVVDSLADVVTENANEGTDTIRSSVAWTLGANLENLTLTGTAALNGAGNTLNNVLMGNSAANNLNAGAGNDTLDGGAGADTMLGGAGDDTYVVDSLADVVTENANEGTDTVRSSVAWTLGANLENLTLTGTAALNGTGNTLNNVLTGNSAANTLDGGAGADTMLGGAGDDTYLVDSLADVVTENANEGTDTVRSSVAWTLGANLENLTLTGTAALNGTGNALNNVLTGNAGANVLDGGAGNDTFLDGSGNDTARGGDGDDVFRTTLAWEQNTYDGGAGRDTVDYSAQSYPTGRPNAGFGGYAGIWVDLSAGKAWRYRYGRHLYDGIPDALVSIENATGSDLQDFLVGDAQANRLEGLAGADQLDGGAGADTLLGGAGDDSYVVDNAADVVTENANEGTDTVRSSVAWTLGANLENLTLTGTAALNGTGNALNNTLVGNSANNVLTGGLVFATLSNKPQDFNGPGAALLVNGHVGQARLGDLKVMAL
jgi:trimeric autotransporter adhesin